MLMSLKCCLNWKVGVGLGAVAVGIGAISGLGSAAAALPLLVSLLCPLSMGVMVWAMVRGGKSANHCGGQSLRIADLERQLAELRAAQTGNRRLCRRGQSTLPT